MSTQDELLTVSHLEKSFGTHGVLKDISFQVKKGDVVSVIGASGSGKSTMLRCINLLETPTGGEICYHGRDITDPKIMLMYGKVSQENYVELTAASAIPNKEIKSPQILRY